MINFIFGEQISYSVADISKCLCANVHLTIISITMALSTLTSDSCILVANSTLLSHRVAQLILWGKVSESYISVSNEGDVRSALECWSTGRASDPASGK